MHLGFDQDDLDPFICLKEENLEESFEHEASDGMMITLDNGAAFKLLILEESKKKNKVTPMKLDINHQLIITKATVSDAADIMRFLNRMGGETDFLT